MSPASTFSGRRVFLRGVSLGAASLVLPALVEAKASQEPTLEELFAGFRKSPGLSARFLEEKHIALLKTPLKSEGAIYFLPKGKLARHVERPKRSVLLLDDRTLKVRDDTGTRSLDLSQHPQLLALVQSFSDVLRGDRAALDKNYRVEFTTSGAAWRLRLIPRAELGKMVTRIELTGKGQVLETLQVDEASGDRAVTRFSDVRANRRFTEEEERRLFTL